MIDSPQSTITHLPSVPMARFGKLDEMWGGGNRYRVIWAPSRKVVLTKPEGTFTAQYYGEGAPRTIERLDCRMSPDLKVGECWILEQWKAPWDVAAGWTPEQWNRNPTMLMQGPYPAKGDYVLIQPYGAFPCVPTLELIERVILLTEDGWKRHSQYENYTAIQAASEKDEKAQDSRNEDRVRNRLLIGSGETFVSSRAARGTKTVVDKYTTRDIGLPTTSGVAFTRTPKKRKTFGFKVQI